SAPYVIHLDSSELTLAKDLTIQGPNTGNGEPIEIRGNGTIDPVSGLPNKDATFRIFTIQDSADVVLDGLKISGGGVTTYAIIDEPDSFGGGILIENGGSLVLVNSEVSGNSAAIGGGISKSS